MKAYILEDDIVIAQITGDNSESIKAKFDDYYGEKFYTLSYSDISELNTDGDFDIIDVRG